MKKDKSLEISWLVDIITISCFVSVETIFFLITTSTIYLSMRFTQNVVGAIVKSGGYPSTEALPMYPEEVLKAFNDPDIFVPLSSHCRDPRLVDYQNAQILLTGAREGRDVIKRDIGIEIIDEDETQQSAQIFTKLKVRRDQVPMKPLTEGKLE